MKAIIKFFLLFACLLSFASCNKYTMKDFIELGDHNSDKVWVYLCGLTENFFAEQEINNRKILNRIGIATKTKFIALKPKNRCKEFNNKLCWPHDNDQNLTNTYQNILNTTSDKNIYGFIGFSNGGFFLNKLAQKEKIQAPIISIGSAGFIEHALHENTIYLIIGKQDLYHYKHAFEFAEQSKKQQKLKVKIIEHDGDHSIPESILIKIIANI